MLSASNLTKMYRDANLIAIFYFYSFIHMRRSLKDSCEHKLTVQNDILIGTRPRCIRIINVSKTAPTGDRSHCSMVWLYDLDGLK